MNEREVKIRELHAQGLTNREIGCLFDDNTLEHWQERFLSMVERDYMHDQMCPYNNLEVPAEGIVVRIDHLDQSEAYKLKNFKYLEWESKELDQGEVDIETSESEETNGLV